MGQPAIAGQPESVGELIASWIATMAPSEWSRFMLDSWKNAAWSTPLKAVDRDHLIRFHQHLKIAKGGQKQQPRPNGPRTIQAKVLQAARVLRWAHRRGLIKVMPDLPTLEKPPRHPKDYNRSQLQEIFGTLPKSPEPILRFILETGCRPSEACKMGWEEVDLNANLCVIDRHKVVKRTGEPRTIALSPAARDILEKIPHREGHVFLNRLKQPFKPGGLRSTLRRSTKKKFSRVYSLRHTRAQSILDNGGTLEDVAAILGNSVNTASVYAKIRGERARRVAATLPSPLQPTPAADSPLCRRQHDPITMEIMKSREKEAPAGQAGALEACIAYHGLKNSTSTPTGSRAGPGCWCCSGRPGRPSSIRSASPCPGRPNTRASTRAGPGCRCCRSRWWQSALQVPGQRPRPSVPRPI